MLNHIRKIIVLSLSRFANIVRKCLPLWRQKSSNLGFSKHQHLEKMWFQGESKSMLKSKLHVCLILGRFKGDFGRHQTQLRPNLAPKMGIPGRACTCYFSICEGVARHFLLDIDFGTVLLRFSKPPALHFGSCLHLFWIVFGNSQGFDLVVL